jgi:hypothetical protein
MNKQHVRSIVRWLWMIDGCPYSCREITIGKLFEASYVYYYGTIDISASIRIDFDLEDFHKYGRIPVYVAHLIREVIYPGFDSSYKKSA